MNLRHPLAVTVIALAAVGCAKKQVIADPAVTEAPTPPPAAVAEAPPPAPEAAEDELEAVLKNTVLYFDLDEAVLSADSQTRLRKLADALRKRPGATVRMAGHCDERGTVEYNLALGERRASAVRDYLVTLGIDASRMSIVSKGEEEPLCQEETEGCWSRNRRGHFTVTSK